MATTLTDEDHRSMDAFLAQTFDSVRAGAVTRTEFIEHMAYALTALDIGNRSEAVLYFKTGAHRFRGASDDASAGPRPGTGGSARPPDRPLAHANDQG